MDQNALYVIGLFDDETNLALKKIDQMLLSAGIKTNEIPFHITFGGYVDIPVKDLVEWVGQFSENHSPLEVKFNHIGLFMEGYCFIAPKVNQELLDFHFDLHQNYDNCLAEVGYNFTLCSDNWVPHMTLINGPTAEILKTIALLLDQFKPFVGKITEMAVYDVTLLNECARFPLQAGQNSNIQSDPSQPGK